MKAKNDTLDLIHQMLAERCLEILRDPESTAAEIAQVRQFLKDNDITAIATSDNGLGMLIKDLPTLDPSEINSH